MLAIFPEKGIALGLHSFSNIEATGGTKITSAQDIISDSVEHRIIIFGEGVISPQSSSAPSGVRS